MAAASPDYTVIWVLAACTVVFILAIQGWKAASEWWDEHGVTVQMCISGIAISLAILTYKGVPWWKIFG